MNVFISWSGDRSRFIAEELRDWLPKVIQSLKPWMSDKDLGKGARWNAEMAAKLETCSFGVICLTQENVTEPWINFEAGALSKIVGQSNVCPYLFELEPTDISGPLTQFQMTLGTSKDTLLLLQTINKAMKELSLADDILQGSFALWWPSLEKKLKDVPSIQSKQPARTDRQLLEETLQTVRAIAQKQEALDYDAIVGRAQGTAQYFTLADMKPSRVGEMQRSMAILSCPHCGGLGPVQVSPPPPQKQTICTHCQKTIFWDYSTGAPSGKSLPPVPGS